MNPQKSKKWSIKTLSTMLSEELAPNNVVRYLEDKENDSKELIFLFDSNKPNTTEYSATGEVSLPFEKGRTYPLDTVFTFRLHTQVKDNRFVGTIYQEDNMLKVVLVATTEVELEMAMVEIKGKKAKEIADIIKKYVTRPRTPNHKALVLPEEEYVEFETLAKKLKEELDANELLVILDNENNACIYINQQINIAQPTLTPTQLADPTVQEVLKWLYPQKQETICIGYILLFGEGKFEITIQSHAKNRYQYMLLKQSSLKETVRDIATFFIAMKK